MNHIELSTSVNASIVHNVYIAYVDILGFSDLVRSKNWREKIERVFEIVRISIQRTSTAATTNIVPKDPLRSLFSSDSIVLWQKPDDDSKWEEKVKALRFLLHAVEKIQFLCAIENIWMRGGISYGEVLYDSKNSNVAGPGYIEAYKLEQVAEFPRVLVDSKIIQDALPNANERKRYLRDINQTYGYSEYSGKFLFDFGSINPTGSTFKQDYPFFVHYLNRLSNEGEMKNLHIVWENLRTNLYASAPKIFRKYQWVLEYLAHYSATIPSDNIDKLFAESPI